MKLKISALIAIALFMLFLLPGRQALAEAGPPKIPEGGFSLQEYVLPKGLKLPVYRGPGKGFGRAAGGKALLSTNGWSQVFGLEGDWLLVQYEINEGQMRFGYVSSKNLPVDEDELLDLDYQWRKEDFVLPIDAVLTDDPLGARASIARLPAGSKLLLLEKLGLWMYVQAKADGKDVRGFLRIHSLRGIPQRDERTPFDLRAVSWGPTELDEATARYWTAWSGGLPKRWPSAQVIYPNVWLRLDSTEYRAYLEDLDHFRVVSGRAVSSSELIPLSLIDNLVNDWMTLYFVPMGGTNRGALEIFMEPGESVENLVIAVDRVRSDNSRETITLPLAGIPLDRGIPDDGAFFSMQSYTSFSRTAAQSAQFTHVSDNPNTLGGLVENVFQGMPEAPREVLDLPLDTPGYRFYLLEGRITKEPGPFGVYDVVFTLDNPPPGVWLSAWQEDDAYQEIDQFDMFGANVILPDGLAVDSIEEKQYLTEETQKGFALLLLVEEKGRDDAELDRIIKGLSIHASFSAEKWNISYEQGGLTEAIGPRSTRQVAMDQLVRKEGVLSELP